MRNKVLAGIAALAIGIGVTSCGENEEPCSRCDGHHKYEAHHKLAAGGNDQLL
jgi:hypothetical protein